MLLIRAHFQCTKRHHASSLTQDQDKLKLKYFKKIREQQYYQRQREKVSTGTSSKFFSGTGVGINQTKRGW